MTSAGAGVDNDLNDAHEHNRGLSCLTRRMDDLRSLVSRFPVAGTLEAIYLRPARGAPALRVDEANALVDLGLDGDRSATAAGRSGPRRGGSRRQVTFLQAEHLPLIAAWSGHATLDAAALRRNLVIAGVNLAAARPLFRDQEVRVCIGAVAIFVVTGDCSPCSKMEAVLGPGGYNALRGHGGVTARVVVAGVVRIGDPVRVIA